MPPAALPGATRRREARGAVLAGCALCPAPCRQGWGAPRASSDFRGINGFPPQAGPPIYSTVRLTPSPLENPDGGRPHRRPVAAFSQRGPACPLAHPLKTRCRPVSGRFAQVEPGGGRKAPLFVRRLADNEPKARRQRPGHGVSPKTSSRPGSGTLRNRLHIVSVLCIISVLIRFTPIRYERSNDHGTSGHHF